jgi:hypothetical protein
MEEGLQVCQGWRPHSTTQHSKACICVLLLLLLLLLLQVAYDPDYIGYDCPNHWVAGAQLRGAYSGAVSA